MSSGSVFGRSALDFIPAVASPFHCSKSEEWIALRTEIFSELIFGHSDGFDNGLKPGLGGGALKNFNFDFQAQ